MALRNMASTTQTQTQIAQQGGVKLVLAAMTNSQHEVGKHEFPKIQSNLRVFDSEDIDNIMI